MTTLQEKSTGQFRSGEGSKSRRSFPFRAHVISAVFKRNIANALSNPAGYVFITLFVAASAVLAFCQDSFFSKNLDDLDSLNAYMPYLLLFFVPAITMSVWAEERKQGTDELLFTLPAHDVDVVLGKYLAAVGMYSIALAFALSFIGILLWLGQPDFGVMFTTYLGYWLMGSMLIAVGMVASLLSSNVTVGFILGGLFCAIPVLFGWIGVIAGPLLKRQFEDLSVPGQFDDFSTGVISFGGLVYFLSLTAAFLYINMVLLGRRHWAGGQKSKDRWAHALVRVVAVIVALASFNVLVGRAGVRADMSVEHLHSLSRESIDLIKQISKDRPVYVQYYVSPEVPREFVETKADLTSLLKEFAARSGGKIRLNIVETELYSNEARDAEKRFGIEPKRVITSDENRQSSTEFTLGVAFSSGLEEVVIPFFDRGLPVEYELTRSIRVVSRTARKKVGILNTDAKLMGGFNMQSFNQTPEWSIVTELKKQYDVDSVAPDQPISTTLDVLLVAQPTSLNQQQIDNLTAYVKNGGAALLFLDPLPYENPQLAPELPKPSPGGPFGGQPPEPKGNLRPLLDLIGLDWPSTEIVWNPYNPIPEQEFPPELVFVGQGSGADDAFNPKDPASSGLQELVTIFTGVLSPKGGGDIEFTPLLRTSDKGGTELWSELTRPGPMGGFGGLNLNIRHVASHKQYTLAARLQGTPAAPADKDKDKDKEKEKEKPAAKSAEIRVIAIADLDMISEQFFQIRRQKIKHLDLDNVTFVLNCVDVLAGDESYVALRKRRLKHRTLSRMEAQVADFDEQRQKENAAAETAAKDELSATKDRFAKQVAELRDRKDMDERTKEIMLADLENVTTRRLEVEQTKIEDEKRHKIQESKAKMERDRRSSENQIRALAIMTPLPALVLGLVVFGVRLGKENVGANPNRLA